MKELSHLALCSFMILGIPPAFAEKEVPSLNVLWEMLQQQQSEIEQLRQENKALRDRFPDDGEPTPIRTTNIAPTTETALSAESAASQAATGTSMDLYGHVMLDMGYQKNQNDPDWFDVMRPTKLPAVKDQYGDNGSFYSGVRQSRLGVRSSTPTALGELKTIFEFELFGVGDDAGQTTFRLRHAWGELGQFGFGQYWSGFMDIDVFPNSIEYWGPNGMVFYRNVQARWTPWSQGDSRFAVTLERPGASGDEGRFEDRVELSGIESDFETPDVTMHYRLADDWGHLQIAGILRKIEWNDRLQDGLDFSGDETGWGVNLSTNYRFGPHVFRGSYVYGEGIQNYMNDGSADIGVRTNFDSQTRPIEGKPIPLSALVAFVDFNWSDEWTSSIGYSLQDNDLPNGASETSFEKGEYALVNLLWHPTTHVFLGPELQWVRRENFGALGAEDVKIQFSAKYTFSAAVGR